QILGIAKTGRLRLAGPIVFLLTPRASLRAVDLDRGELWNQPLAAKSDDLRAGPMPQPALSESAVAVAYTLNSRRQPPTEQMTRIGWFDRASGAPGRTLTLPQQSGDTQYVKLVPLGTALVVEGQN